MRPSSPEHDFELDPNKVVLQKFTLYETRARFYLVGKDKAKEHWRILKIDRSEPSDLVIVEDPLVYTEQQCRTLLRQLAEGNRSSGGLQLVTKAYGIVGFIKFLEPWYVILVTKRRQIGSLCGHIIYGIDESQLITIPHSSVQSDVANSKTELRYKKLLSGVDLTKDFYFSYTYPLMRTLQRNVTQRAPGEEPRLRRDGESAREPYESMFVWNAYLTKGVRQMLGNARWTVALCHGFFQQAKLSIFGRVFVITLIARRSRHFAGTRYLKRGVNDKGRVANEVETEQIVLDDDSGAGGIPAQMTSVVQLRGSIPLYWSQEVSRLSAKPDIQLHKFDPMYTSTKLHFEDVEHRYGNPIIILNLIKTFEKRPREMILRREFGKAATYLNMIRPPGQQLIFIHWDFAKFAKSKSANVSANVLTVLGSLARECLDMVGVYCSGKPSINAKRRARLQRASANNGDLLPMAPSSSRDSFSPSAAGPDYGRPSPARDFSSDPRDSASGSAATGGVRGDHPLPSQPPSTAHPHLHHYQNPNLNPNLNPTSSSSALYQQMQQQQQQQQRQSHTYPSDRPASRSGSFRSQDVASDPALNHAANHAAIQAANRAAWSELDSDPERAPQFQAGVLRTNCIDCLDRTNVAQYAFGLEALGRQLHLLGLSDETKLDPESGAAAALMELYQSMGDVLALQYGGSPAHNTVFPERQGKWRATTQSREFLLSIRRYYSNAYTDAEKQDAINLFLGHFEPREGRPSLWELDTASHQFMGGAEDSPRALEGTLSDSAHQPIPETTAGVSPWTANPFHPALAAANEGGGRTKLTSFDKLSEMTCGSVKSVRLFPNEDKTNPETPASLRRAAADAAEVQFGLSSPEWLFGQRRKTFQEDSAAPSSDAMPDTPLKISKLPENGGRLERNSVSVMAAAAEVELYERYLAEASLQYNSWYGTRLLLGTVEDSEANRFYQYWAQGFSPAKLETRLEPPLAFDFLAQNIARSERDAEVRQAMEDALGLHKAAALDFGSGRTKISTHPPLQGAQTWMEHTRSSMRIVVTS